MSLQQSNLNKFANQFLSDDEEEDDLDDIGSKSLTSNDFIQVIKREKGTRVFLTLPDPKNKNRDK